MASSSTRSADALSRAHGCPAPARSRPGATGRDRGQGEGVFPAAAASRKVATHLADRRRVRELLDLRRRVQRRAARLAVRAPAVPLHGHPSDAAGDTPVGYQRRADARIAGVRATVEVISAAASLRSESESARETAPLV